MRAGSRGVKRAARRRRRYASCMDARRLRPVVAALAFMATGCHYAINYPDPTGPRFGSTAANAIVAPGDPPGARVVVGSYNVEFGRDIPAVLRVIRADSALARADILTLEETDEHAAEALGAALGWQWVFYPAAIHPATGGNYGSAILSRWPIVADRKLLLPHVGWRRHLRRATVCATVMVHGRPIRAYAIHFSTMWELTAAGQDDQARTVLADAEGSPDPVVVAGDFNRKGAAEVFATQGYAWPTRQVGATHHLWSFDHVVARGLGTPVAAGRVRDPANPSDHAPVWAEFALP